MAEPKKIQLTRATWIMSGPGRQFTVLLKLKKGDVFSVIEKTIAPDGQGWWRLAFRDGYVISSAIKFIDENPKTSDAGNGDNPTPSPDAVDPSPSLNYSRGNGPGSAINPKGTLGPDDAKEIDVPRVLEKLPQSYYADYNYIEKSLKEVRYNLNLMKDYDHVKAIHKAQFQRFNRFKLPYPDLQLSKSFGYVFFVRPNLNLFKNGNDTLVHTVSLHPYFYHMHKSNPEVLKSLTSSYSKDHKFLPLLSNHALSFEVQDEYIKTEEYGETYSGFKSKYARNDVESKSAGSVSIQFSDDSSLSVYNLFKSWITYMSNVYRGEFEPRYEDIMNKEIDYATAAYYFLCGPDGETIIFWSKYFGMIPTTAVSSIFSYSKGNHVKLPEFSVPFEYSSKEDMNPLTFYEFNKLSNSNYTYKRIFSTAVLGAGKTMAGAPFVETVTDKGGNYEFKLKFRV